MGTQLVQHVSSFHTSSDIKRAIEFFTVLNFGGLLHVFSSSSYLLPSPEDADSSKRSEQVTGLKKPIKTLYFFLPRRCCDRGWEPREDDWKTARELFFFLFFRGTVGCAFAAHAGVWVEEEEEEEEAVNSSLKRTLPPLGPKAAILGAKFDGDFKLKWNIILRTQLSV